MKLFLDTNYLLDFYRYGKEHLSVLQDIKKFSSNLIFPEQVLKEFIRRASDVQNQALKNFRDAHSSLSHPPSSLLQGLEAYEEYKLAKSNFKKISDKVITELQSGSWLFIISQVRYAQVKIRFHVYYELCTTRQTCTT